MLQNQFPTEYTVCSHIICYFFLHPVRWHAKSFIIIVLYQYFLTKRRWSNLHVAHWAGSWLILRRLNLLNLNTLILFPRFIVQFVGLERCSLSSKDLLRKKLFTDFYTYHCWFNLLTADLPLLVCFKRLWVNFFRTTCTGLEITASQRTMSNVPTDLWVDRSTFHLASHVDRSFDFFENEIN